MAFKEKAAGVITRALGNAKKPLLEETAAAVSDLGPPPPRGGGRAAGLTKEVEAFKLSPKLEEMAYQVKAFPYNPMYHEYGPLGSKYLAHFSDQLETLGFESLDEGINRRTFAFGDRVLKFDFGAKGSNPREAAAYKFYPEVHPHVAEVLGVSDEGQLLAARRITGKPGGRVPWQVDERFDDIHPGNLIGGKAIDLEHPRPAERWGQENWGQPFFQKGEIEKLNAPYGGTAGIKKLFEDVPGFAAAADEMEAFVGAVGNPKINTGGRVRMSMLRRPLREKGLRNQAPPDWSPPPVPVPPPPAPVALDIPQVMRPGRVVGFAGVARTGKDTAADVLVNKYGYERLQMSAPMMKQALDDNPRIDAAGMSLRSVVDELGWDRAKDEVPGVRQTLIDIGNAGRAEHGGDYWTKVALEQADPAKNYVVTGLRMQSEVDKINEIGGSVLRINRPGAVPQGELEQGIPQLTGVKDIQNTASLQRLHRRVERQVIPRPRRRAHSTARLQHEQTLASRMFIDDAVNPSPGSSGRRG